MHPNEALQYLKEILKENPNLSLDSISFEEQPGAETIQRILIKCQADQHEENTIRNIAQKHGLTVITQKEWTIIYKPKPIIQAP